MCCNFAPLHRKIFSDDVVSLSGEERFVRESRSQSLCRWRTSTNPGVACVRPMNSCQKSQHFGIVSRRLVASICNLCMIHSLMRLLLLSRSSYREVYHHFSKCKMEASLSHFVSKVPASLSKRINYCSAKRRPYGNDDFKRIIPEKYLIMYFLVVANTLLHISITM